MIKTLKVTNHLGESMLISMGSPAMSGFSIRGIDGLGPPKGDINVTEVLGMDGGYFNSSRTQLRNILLTLGMEDQSYTPEELRLKSYKYFPIKKQLELEVETDTRSAKIKGYVESNSPNIFSKDETTAISIICPNPYFYSLCSTLTIFTTIESLFEFPFSNESTTEPLIVFGDVLLTDNNVIYYDGDAPVGVYISIKAFGEVTNLAIHNFTNGQSMFIDTTKLETLTGFPIIAGDEILISTIKGGKFIYLLRDGVTYNILNCLANTSTWFEIGRGENTFIYEAETGQSNMTFEIMNNTLYEGV